jgi:hypothetical protein
MVSRANRENREEIPTYGTPMGPPPTPTPEREEARREKLATKPTAAERRERIREHEEKAREESEKLEQEAESRKTEAPGPVPYETVRQPGGGTPAQILKERGEDVATAIERGEGIEREPEPGRQPVTVAPPRVPIRERDRPKQ